MKPIEYCLDETLNKLAHNYGFEPRPPLDAVELLSLFDVPQGRHEFFKSIINILIDDGYVDFLDFDAAKNRYHASLESYKTRTIILPKGFYFLENGAYRQQKAYNLKVISDIHDRERRMERNESRLMKWTRNLFYGTIAAALMLVTWDVIKTFWIEGHQLPFCDKKIF